MNRPISARSQGLGERNPAFGATMRAQDRRAGAKVESSSMNVCLQSSRGYPHPREFDARDAPLSRRDPIRAIGGGEAVALPTWASKLALGLEGVACAKMTAFASTANWRRLG
jgi:hypothetical protein